jgi:type IV pilus assembly protein PilM
MASRRRNLTVTPRRPRRVGLEVSNSAVRIAEVSVTGSRVKLINLGQVRLPQRAVVDGAIEDVSAVQSAIERCMKEGGFSTKEVHVGVAGLRAITRELDMPHVPDNELDSAVRLQALDVIPFPIDKTLMSARPLEDVTAADGAPMRRVLLAAAHRDLVDPLLEAVSGAGLTPLSVDLTSTALIRSLYDPATATGRPEAIVAIGSGLTTIVVHEHGVPHFVRTVAEGGDTVTAAISGALDLPIEDAEATKRNLDQAGPHIRAAATAAAEASASLIGEIRSSIEYYSSLPGRDEVTRVTLTGGGSRLIGLAERLQGQVRAEVVRGSALASTDCGGLKLSPDELARRDPLIATVVGLALPDAANVKPLDLLPPEIAERRKARRKERMLIAAALLVVLGLAGGGALRYLQVRKAENTVTGIDGSIINTNAQIAKYDTARADVARLHRDQLILTPVVAGEVNWPAVFAAITHNTPAGGVVTSISGTNTASVATTAASGKGSSSAPIPPAEQQIASVSVQLQSKANYPYFELWYNQLARSGELQLTQWSPFSEPSPGTVSYSATISVLGAIKSSRLSLFEVPSS